MGAVFSYSLGVSVFLLFGYLTYKLFLSAEKQAALNRMALISIYIISLVAIPLLAVEWGSAEPVAAGSIELGGITVSVVPAEAENAGVNVPRILLAGYLLGMAVTAVFTLAGVVRLLMLLRGGRREDKGGYTVITLPCCEVPFSFGRYVVVGSGETAEAQELIEAHESAHLGCRHWADLVLAQGVCVLLWYNPVAWLMREELRQVHEYQADASVLSQGFDPYAYQMLLIKKAAGRRLQSLANSLNHSNLSKRITMMYKTENRALRSMRALALLPAIVLAALAVEQPAVATTIEQAGSGSLISAPAVAEPVADGKISENLSDYQLPEAVEVADVQPEAAEESVSAAPAVMPQAVAEPEEKEVVHSSVQQMPQFPGGDRAMMEYIMEHMKYPEDAMEAGDEGRVVVRFVVGSDGAVRDASILRGRTESLNAEALRVVSSLPAFIPGKVNGEPVAVYYTLPVSFKLKKDDVKVKEVEHYTGNLSINPDGSKPQPAYFVNGKPFDGNIKDIPSEKIAEITLVKNDPEYPNGKMDITLKD